MSGPFWIRAGAICGAVGVALGAFGAHGLAERLAEMGYDVNQVARRTDIFETAVRYQMYHAPAMILVGLLALRESRKCLTISGMCFLFGVSIFSGLLYVLVFAGENWKWLGAVVPLGGVALIVGWVALAVGSCKRGTKEA